MSDPVSQVKNAADILEVISEIIPVKRSGTSYVSICPFHDDSKPSMHISPSKGIFKCFACGIGGDVFKFWSEYYQKDFKETLKDLCQKYGIPLEYSNENKEKTERFNLSVKMHELAAEYYHNKLMGANEAQVARDYLNKRQISTTTINQFELGFSLCPPQQSDALVKYLKEKLKVSDEQIFDAGLSLKSEKYNKYYDRFRNRLMIPIQDERDRTIGFGARQLLPDDNGPKYLNSPETDIYHKSSVLYGMNEAKEYIRKKDGVILVEGFFDVISLSQAGVKNVVANQGTALTAQQIKLLAKFTQSKKIFMCFDTDEAGEKASDRAAELASEILKDVDYELKTIRVPGEKDADEYIKDHSKEAFDELIQNAPLYIDYKINKAITETDLSSPQAKAKTVKVLNEYLSQINNKIVLNEYFKIIAEKLNIPEAVLRDEFTPTPVETPYSPAPSIKKEAPKRKVSNRVNGHIIYTKQTTLAAELEMLVLCFKVRTMLENFMQEELQLLNEASNHILDALIEISFSNPDLSDSDEKFKKVSEFLQGHENCSEALAELGMMLDNQIAEVDDDDKYRIALRLIRQSHLEQKVKDIKEEMAKIDDSNSEYLVKMQEKNTVEKQLQKLKVAS